ncbi:MAG: HupU protein [Rhodospirillales bacterium]|nr:HupU protein [Rhodospirillales bacterium]
MTASNEYNVLWLQAASCGGCTMSLLGEGNAGLVEFLKTFGINILWHPTLSEESGPEALAILEDVASGKVRLDALCVEGSILLGPKRTGRFQMFSGTGRSMFSWVSELAVLANNVLAVGSCAAFGGIISGNSTPTDARGLQFLGDQPHGALGDDFRSKSGLPVINIAGCAPHPGWITEVLVSLSRGEFTADDLDAFARPRLFADHLAHHGCVRNEFYEYKASAANLSQKGCLMEKLGCKATQASGDCNFRTWNGGPSCTNAGYSCISCTSPGFEKAEGFLKTPTVAGLPVGLPVDMPKAWYVALAALSKSATPDRVKKNSRSDHIIIPPRRGESQN